MHLRMINYRSHAWCSNALSTPSLSHNNCTNKHISVHYQITSVTYYILLQIIATSLTTAPAIPPPPHITLPVCGVSC